MNESLTSRRRFLQSLGLVTGALATGAFSLSSLAKAEEAAPSTGKLEIQPYLQNPTHDAMTICYLSQDARDVKVLLGSPKSASTKAIRAIGTAIPETNWTIWKARATGLKAGEIYNYSVSYKVGNEEKSSAKYSFTPLNLAAPDVYAIAINDGHDHLEGLETLLKNTTPGNYQFSLLLGDMWNDPSPKDNAERVFKTMEGYVRLLDASNRPLFYIRGNHDTRGGFADKLSYLFDLPNNRPASKLADQNAYYDFQCGPVWFISPDAGEDGDKRAEMFQAYRQRQIPWLKKIFGQSPAARKAPWRVLALHIPLYNPGGWDQPDALKRWEPVFEKEHIDLMIAGHDHTPRYVEKEKPFKRDGKEEVIAPYPVLIGGGPGNGSTIMLIKADAKNLNARLLSIDNKELWNVKLTK